MSFCRLKWDLSDFEKDIDEAYSNFQKLVWTSLKRRKIT
jgi:hypothetical protein